MLNNVFNSRKQEKIVYMFAIVILFSERNFCQV